MASFDDLEKYLNDGSFVRWIIGKADREESMKWEKWEKSDPANSELASEARAFLGKMKSLEPVYPNPNIDLRQLQRRIDRYEQEKEIWTFSKYEKRKGSIYIGIAASIVILIGLIFIYQSVKQNKVGQNVTKVASIQEFQTDYGQKSTLKLSDGSRIILNANSTLKFASDPNKGANIDIWLNGEAYFSVVHLKNRVVRVHTRGGIITDLGTEFSVNSRSDKTFVALVKGHVKVANNTGNSKIKGERYLLNPNDLAILQKGGKKVQIRQVSTDIYTSWITDKLVCDHTPLRQIINRMEATYGVKVIVNGTGLLSTKLSGILKNSDLTMLEKALSRALKLPVIQQGKKVYIGNYKQ